MIYKIGTAASYISSIFIFFKKILRFIFLKQKTYLYLRQFNVVYIFH